jgi:hypothetical protein
MEKEMIKTRTETELVKRQNR